MDKMQKPIMVIKRDTLFSEGAFQGFKPATDLDYSSRILENFEYMPRGLAEQDPNFKQPIGYAVLLNPSLKKIFAYRRSKKDEEYTETRLQGKYSWGVGGHIDKSDAGNPIHSSLLREIEEEIGLRHDQIQNIRVLGYVNDDENDVGRVHFCILYGIETAVADILPKSEIMHGKLMTIDELEELVSNPEVEVETWSKIAFGPIKTQFSSLDETLSSKAA